MHCFYFYYFHLFYFILCAYGVVDVLIDLCLIGYTKSRSKQAPFPFSKNVTVDLIAEFGNRLWRELVGWRNDDEDNVNNDHSKSRDIGGGGVGKLTTMKKVTNVSLTFMGVEMMEVGQKGIEGFFGGCGGGPASTSNSTSISKPKSKLTVVADKSTNAKVKVEQDTSKSGEKRIVKLEKGERDKGSFFCSSSSPGSFVVDGGVDGFGGADVYEIQSGNDIEDDVAEDNESKDENEEKVKKRNKSPGGVSLSHKCERCGKVIGVTSRDLDTQQQTEEDEEEILKRKYDSLRIEHEDYHFAADLAKENGGTFKSTVNAGGKVKKRKVGVVDDGGSGSGGGFGGKRKKVQKDEKKDISIARYFSRDRK